VLPAVLPSWRLERFADGLGLVPPGGRAQGGIRIRDRQRPLKSITQLFRDAASTLALDNLDATPLEPLLTAEGEYAATSTLTGAIDGHRIERTLAFVLGDDHYTRIDGVTLVPERFAQLRGVVRELSRLYSLGLGFLRRRRYLYEPPVGWGGYPRGLTTEWLAPGYPADDSTLTVFPARPVIETAADSADMMLHELGWTGFQPVDATTLPLITPHLSGQVRSYRGMREGRPRHVHLAILEDGRFFYMSRLDAPADGVTHVSVLRDLLASVIPLPVPQPPERAAPDGDVFGNWSD
jgi:hypothetical protein